MTDVIVVYTPIESYIKNKQSDTCYDQSGRFIGIDLVVIC